MRFALLAIAFFASLASAATIHGIVYDSNLEPVDGAIVQVNTLPRQQMVAQNGSYAFEVPSGNYSLRASRSFNGSVYYTEENLSVQSEGEFTLDLIFLSFAPVEEIDVEQLPEDLPQVIPSQAAQVPSQSPSLDALLLVAVGAFVFLVIALVLLKARQRGSVQKARPKKKHAPEKATPSLPAVVVTPSQRQLLEQLARTGGRMTQKELRKALPNASEAAVSMDLTELEDAGAIKKIKKGRGNIIKLLSPPKP